jgi:hypothetical protein
MARTLRGNARWVSALIGVPDAYAVQTTNALATHTNTLSPAARGVQRFLGELPGSGVNQWMVLGGPQQAFAGVDVRIIQAGGVSRAYGTLDAGSLPSTSAGIGSGGPSVAWLDLGRIANTGYGG